MSQERESTLWRFVRSALVTLFATSVLLFLIMVSFNRHPEPTAEPTLTEDEYIEELMRLEDEIIKNKLELIELYKLKKLGIEGKLHSS